MRLRATFEPVPLYAVMAKQGLEHWTEQIAHDDWCVWFYSARSVPAETATPSGPTVSGVSLEERAHADPLDNGVAEEEEETVVLDVRGLEPPEPLVLTLEALERLPPGGTLVQINVREPRFLLPELEARGFTWEVREQSKDLVRVFIRRSAEP